MSGCQSCIFVELHGAVVAAPDVQGQKGTVAGLGKGHGMVVKAAADVLAAAVFIHAQIVDVKFFPVSLDAAAGVVSDLAEAVTGHKTALHRHKNRRRL